jgi:hypothetical protein
MVHKKSSALTAVLWRPQVRFCFIDWNYQSSLVYSTTQAAEVLHSSRDLQAILEMTTFGLNVFSL